MSSALAPEHTRWLDATATASPGGDYGAVGKQVIPGGTDLEFKTRELKSSVADTYAICSALLVGFCTCTVWNDHYIIEHEDKTDKIRF